MNSLRVLHYVHFATDEQPLDDKPHNTHFSCIVCRYMYIVSRPLFQSYLISPVVSAIALCVEIQCSSSDKTLLELALLWIYLLQLSDQSCSEVRARFEGMRALISNYSSHVICQESECF